MATPAKPGSVNFSDRNEVEQFLEGGRFRRCANLQCVPAHLKGIVLYMPVCSEGRFAKEGLAQHMEMPLPGRPLSPVTYTTVQTWGPLLRCPASCKGYQNQTLAKLRALGRGAARWLFEPRVKPTDRNGKLPGRQGAQGRRSRRQTDATLATRFRSLPRLFQAIIAATPVIALYFTYAYTGADDLRAKVYQPLYAEVAGLEESLQANSIEKPVVNTSLQALKRSGDFQRVPKGLQTRVEAVYGRANEIGADIPAITEDVQRLLSSGISRLRTKTEDEDWQRSAIRRLELERSSAPGISPMVLFNLSHAGRSRGVDVRNPKDPKITSPGGPTWVINDWIGYPATIAGIESLWGNDDYLYFDEVHDEWYYRVTRDDLRQHGIDLRGFLGPLYQGLLADAHFQQLLRDGSGSV